ncbi:MAG TPA: sortase [Herpetosiphonaceae bacterium]|nr:sortase [Herpetosiphonaceae bacterium]
MRSIAQQRNVALRGYRFRGLLDILLFRFERVLMVILVGFFSFWVYDTYARDWWHALQNPSTAVPVDWAQIQPGASAAEIDRVLGSRLPSAAPAKVSVAQAPDYLVPAQRFVLPPSAPTATPAPLDQTPLFMYVPALELQTPIKEVFLREDGWEVADYAVGYHHGTAHPGSGNTVTAGHAGLRGGVYARLPELQIGNDIYVETASTRFHYQVSEIKSVWPTQVEVMYPTAEPILTMITCTAWDTQRLVVKANLVDQTPLSSKVGGGESRGFA